MPSRGLLREEVLLAYHVARQAELTRNAEACFFGKAPTLGDLNRAYGDGTAQEWLVYQLDDLSEYCGAREKLTARQMQTLSELISQEYSWLKLTEMMLFLRWFKLGRYERFYGTVDPQVIVASLRRFMTDRNKALCEHDDKMERIRREREAADGKVTWEQYRLAEAEKRRAEARRLESEGKMAEAKEMYGEAEAWESRLGPTQLWSLKRGEGSDKR